MLRIERRGTMNWLELGKKLLASKKGREKGGKAIRNIIIGLLLLVVVAALLVVLLFNVFICTVSFGLIGGCDDGKKEVFQVITDDEFEDMGRQMDQLRIKTNEEVDVPGKNYQEYKSSLNGKMINEAEVHIRALYQMDYYAIQTIDMTDKGMLKKFGEPKEGGEEGELTLENSDKRIVMIWEMAKQLQKEEKENDSWWNKRSKEWKFKRPDWFMAVQFDVYRCFFIGDEESSIFKPTTWFGMGSTPCADLDNLYNRATGNSKTIIPYAFTGVIEHIHVITQQSWVCVKDPEPTPAPTPAPKKPVSFLPNLEWSLFETVKAHHLDAVLERGPSPSCGSGYHAEHGKDIVTTYVTYVDLLDMVYAYEQFSIFVPGETVSTDETYKDYINYILRELYDMYFGDSSLVPIPGGGEWGMGASSGWLIPMQEGTYYRTSPFGWRNIFGEKDFHYGVDMATHKTKGVPIYATKGGVVTFANPSSSSPVGSGANNKDVTGCEGAIIVAHDDGTSATYCHMFREDILVQTGWKIVQGQMIAGVGNGGASTGHHLDIKLCLKTTGGFSCQDGNKNPEKINKDFIDPEKEPVSWVLNTSTTSVTQQNLKNSLDYFKEVSSKLKKESNSKREALAQTFLMPGFSSFNSGKGGMFGMLAWKYETNFKGPGTCSSGAGDIGGISCGVHQLSKDSQKTFVAWLQSRGTSPYSNYYSALAGVQTGTSAFATKWKALGEKNEMEFYQIQEEYFSMAYFGPAIKTWQTLYGKELRSEPLAIQSAAYSMYIQHGPGNNVMKTILNKNEYASETPANIINKMYNERSKTSGSVLVRFSGNSASVQRGVYNRLRYNEKCDALAILMQPNLDLRSGNTGCTYQSRDVGQ